MQRNRGLFAAALGALLSLSGFAAGMPGRVYAPVVTNAFRITYSVAFEKGQKLKNVIYYHYLDARNLPEDKWWTSEMQIGFEDVTRVYGHTTGKLSCIPFMHRKLMDGISPEPGEKRRVEIVHYGEYVSIYQEVGGKMVLFNRTAIPAWVRLGAVSFAKDSGTVSNLKLSVASDAREMMPWKVSQKLPARGKRIAFLVQPGVYPASVILKFPDGTANPPFVTLSSFRQDFQEKKTIRERKEENGVPVFRDAVSRVRHVIDDTGLEVNFGNRDIRPAYSQTRIGGRYRDDQMGEILKHLDRYGEPASRHAFRCEIRRSAAGYELWIEHNFTGLLKVPEQAAEVVVMVPNEGTILQLDEPTTESDPMKLELAVPVPFDTSVCKVNLGSFLLECDGYLSREPVDRLPDAYLRRVPTATYSAAILKCRVDAAPTNSCKVTARLTNFHCPHTEGRSPEAITQKTVELPRTNGVYEVRLDLDPGKIQDMIYDTDDFLDFEVLGGIDTLIDKMQSFDYRPSQTPSGVTLLAATLVRSEAGLKVTNGAYRNLFVAGETACVTALVSSVCGGSYQLVCEEFDKDDKLIKSNRRPVRLAAGGRAEILLHFAAKAAGWYPYEVRIEDAAGHPVVRYPGAFAIVGSDTRKAGFESPFYTWDGAGLADLPTFRRHAAYLKKLGLRRARLRNYSEADAADFGLTLGECHAFRVRGATQAEREANFEADAREAMAKWPNISSALILHEHYGTVNPSELTGGTTVLTDAQRALQQQNVEEAAWRARIWRKVAPHVKLKVGNAGSSLSIMGDLFRGGYPKDLIDLIGEESVGQMQTPERATGWSFRNLKDLANIYGYTNGIAACYEWKSRVRRLFASPRKQAAWFMRDSLIALAWGSDQVTVETGPEIGSSYFNSCWGSGALTRLDQPLPQLAAVGNLTRVLDRCTFSRLVPTGSQTVYLLEFRNPEGAYVYAVWTARGEIKAMFRSKASSLVVTDMYGGEDKRVLTARFKARISEEPSYFTMDAPIVSAEATGARDYPWETYPAMKNRRILAPLATLAGWMIETNDMPRLNRCYESGRPAVVDATNEQDDGNGCVAVTLKQETDCPPMKNEYCFLRADSPLPVPEAATTLCLEAKGNSSWGKLMFEIEDAGGRRWLTAGPSYDYFDLSDTLSLNFDGWHLLQFQIRPESPAKCYSLGSNMRQWQYLNGPGKHTITYPVKVTAIGFKLRRWGFDLLNWTPLKSDTVHVRNLSAY